MRRALHIVAVLTAAGLFAGGVLAYVYKVTDPMIRANRAAERDRAVAAVVPGTAGKTFDENTGVYTCKDDAGNLIGYAFQASGSGFQGPIVLMVGLSADLSTITGIYVLESSETPGLGAKINTEHFQDQFRGLVATEGVRLVKNKPGDKAAGKIRAITGATISSRAVVAIINARVAEVRAALRGEGS